MSMPMILEQPSDAELMARVREGDRDAFSDLVDRHKDAVVSYLTRLSGDRDRADGRGVARLGRDRAQRECRGQRRDNKNL